MNEQGMTQDIAMYPSMYSQPMTGMDKGILVERTQFSQEIKNLRIALTGTFFDGARSIRINDHALLCEKHFNMLLPKLFLANTKATTLSKVYADTVEKYIVDLMNNQEAWFIKKCYSCEDCGIKGDYDTINELMDAIEPFFYFNFSRAIDGFEAEKLAQSHQSSEVKQVISDERKSGFLSLRKGFLGGGK